MAGTDAVAVFDQTNARSYVRSATVRPSAETSPAVTASPIPSESVPAFVSVVGPVADGLAVV